MIVNAKISPPFFPLRTSRDTGLVDYLVVKTYTYLDF